MRLVVLAAALVIALPALGQAPSDRPRFGAYIDASVAYGSYGLNPSGCTAPSCPPGTNAQGFAWGVSLGGTFNPTWRLGIQMNNYTTDFSAAYHAAITFFTLAGTWYPSENASLWIRANIGLASVHLPAAGGTTFAGGVGIGYDLFPVGTEVSVTPWVDYMTQITSVPLGPGNGSVRAQLFEVGVALGLRH
jgi:hypothetical protein